MGLRKFLTKLFPFTEKTEGAGGGGDDLPKATQYFADKARVECRVEKPLCRIERKCLDEKKSGDRCHEWKTCHKASTKQKNKDMIERLLKGGE